MASDTLAISVLIPTHNRAQLLRRTLESLREVKAPHGIMAEIVVVANACTDATTDVCAALAASFPLPLRWVVESNVGASHARNRLLAEARGDILAFLDDDVFVEHRWLEGLLEVFAQYPAGLVAGRVELWWDAVARPRWLTHRSAHLLSCVDYGSRVRELLTAGEAISANLAIRRCVLKDVSQFRTDVDRVGRQVVGGGDTDFIARALAAGHRMFYAPRASIRHWVAPERITMDYLGRAARGLGLGKVLTMSNLSPSHYRKIFIENGIKIGFYAAMEKLSAVAGYQKGRINQHIRRMTCRGALDALRQNRMAKRQTPV